MINIQFLMLSNEHFICCLIWSRIHTKFVVTYPYTWWSKERLLLELEKCEFVHGIKLMAYCLLYIQGKHNNNKYFWKWTNTKYWLPRTLQSLNYTMELQKKLWAKIFADEFKIIKIINYKVKKRKICDFLTYNFLLPVWLIFFV